jgi:tryptophanyl-tRNA synthetase
MLAMRGAGGHPERPGAVAGPAGIVPTLMARVFSGIKPSGDVQLGNLIGAIRHWVADQELDDCLYCIVDLHAITVPQDPSQLHAWTLELAGLLIAAGIDPERSTLFVQSHLHEHAELAWVLNCFTTFGELRRMTQFKEKAQKEAEGSATVGFFDYPVLQAADILLYDTDRVPVGDDQRQHVELTRDIAGRFNQRFGDTFVLPEPVVPPEGARIMDLQNPSAKMSKSSESPQGTLLLLDPPDVLRRKIRSAVTDSGREVTASPDKPALTNLLTIMSAATGRPVAELEASYAGRGYAEFKAELAEAVVELLAPLQKRYAELAADPAELARLLDVGANKARALAAPTLERVFERVGFARPQR